VKILLWDIDGTLIRSGNAGLRAMNCAAARVLGVPAAFDNLEFAGRTDPWAISTVCGRHGLAPAPRQLGEFYAVYVEELRSELHNPHARVCAGIHALLEHFHREPGVVQGLLTGNISAGARVKLEHFSLWQYFAFGAFADDSGDRNALAAIALERARTHSNGTALSARNLVVIGDTPHDAACARHIGARSALTATGRFGTAELAACGPDLLVQDFADPQPLLEFVSRLD